MYKTFISIVLILSGTILFAQNRQRNRNQNQTPQSVQDAFRRDHPNASNANWSRNNNQWHATYKDNSNNNRNVEAYYDSRGRHQYNRIEWDRNNLPKDYDNRIRTKYHTTNYRVTRIERPNNPSLFELILSIGGRNRTVYTDERGNEVRFNLGR